LGGLVFVRRAVLLLLGIIVCFACWQIWLMRRVMEQDRKLAAQHSRERVEQISGLAIAGLANTLRDWELSLREVDALPPSAAVKAKLPGVGILVMLGPQSEAIYPPRPLLFTSNPLPLAAALTKFEALDALEFREQNYTRALEELAILAGRKGERPEALLRIARIHRKLHQQKEALAAYEQLAVESGMSPGNVPYSLLAVEGRCQALLEASESERAVTGADALHEGLLAARWRLRRETFDWYWNEANRFRHTSDPPPPDLIEFVSTVERLRGLWQRAISSETSTAGRELRPDSGLLVWSATQTRVSAAIAPAGWLATVLQLPRGAEDIRWRLLPDPSKETASRVKRSLLEAGLPGTLEFWTTQTSDGGGERQNVLWLSVIALTVALLLSGAYAVYRGMEREIRVARMQSDFVSAVSHEFRSPLTAIRSIAELLAQNRIHDESRRRQSYDFLERETARLQRLVEDLLDWGRMESGNRQYRIESFDAFLLVQDAVAEFRESAMDKGFDVKLELPKSDAPVQADQQALMRVLHNLLDNAAKYSPECRTIWVDGALDDRRVSISVRDQGIGIEGPEQAAIFQKFVRGHAAKKAGIRGSGIGLAIVRETLEALGGKIQVVSAPGAGSTFTVLLPLAREGSLRS
jgi:signal transduction histidine kinase